MMPTKYPNFVKIVLASGCYFSFYACSSVNGYDEDAINQRSVYRDDDSRDLLPTPEQASQDARQYKVDEEKKIAQRKKGDEAIAAAESDGTLNDLAAAYTQILVPGAQEEQPYFAPTQKGLKGGAGAAMQGTIKTGGTTRRKPVFLGKLGLEAMIQKAKAVNVNAPAAVTGGMSFSARAGRGAESRTNAEAMGSYIVQAGDTLSTISARIYGTSSRWMELAHLNRLGNGSVIFPNELILYAPDKTAVAP